MRHKKIKNKNSFFLIVFLFFLLFLPYLSLANQFDYEPMEKIPGFETQDLKDFDDYISVIYKFGIWAVGIAALLMIVIGGFMYITSAGNNASMEKAKGVITDAIAGLLLALTSWLILYTINPALVTISPITPSGVVITPGLLPGPGVRVGTGQCLTAGSGSCSVTDLKTKSKCFTTDLLAFEASHICQEESNSVDTKVSGVDKCKDGNSFSIGLFQINLIVHGKKLGAGCSSQYVFNIYGNGGQGTCLHETASGVCYQYDCTVKDPARYAACANLLKNAATNISLACTISSNGKTWRPWGANRKCGY